MRDCALKQQKELEGLDTEEPSYENSGLGNEGADDRHQPDHKDDNMTSAVSCEPHLETKSSRPKSIDEKEHTAEELASYKKLVSGEKMDVTGLEGMNAAAFVLQSCRFHRGEQGIVDNSTGEIVKYTQLYRCVQRVSVGLKERSFREGNVLRVGIQSASSFRLLVLTLAVWNLMGVVELQDAMDDDGLDSLGEGAEKTEGTSKRARSPGVWLVCDSVRHMQRQLSRVEWRPEQTIIIADAGGERVNTSMVYADLLSTDSVQPIVLSRVRWDMLLSYLGLLMY